MGLRAVLSVLLVAASGLEGSMTPTTVQKVQRVPSVMCDGDISGVSLHNFVAQDIWKTKNISLSDYRGKVVLVVNVATYCGFTPHYHGINALQSSFHDFVALGFPCNQFGLQEPGANATEILNGVKHVRPGSNFVPNFHMFAKVEVNGENEHPLFTFLKSQCPSTRDGHSAKEELWYKPLRSSDIRWNFEKILVGKDGQPYKRYDPSFDPMNMREDIQTLLRRPY